MNVSEYMNADEYLKLTFSATPNEWAEKKHGHKYFFK